MRMKEIKTATMILLVIVLSGCGDLVNPPPPQTQPSQPPNQESSSAGKSPKSETRDTKSKTRPQATDERRAPLEVTREEQMCEQEREWAYEKGLIDANQLSLFRKRNLAPVYRIRGERQSGVESWFRCEAALRMNDFI